MATWADVRALALALPEVVEGTSYRQPAFRVAGRFFAGLSPHEAGALVVRVDPEERPFLLEAHEGVLFVTPHYEPGGYMLVRLDAADPEVVRERLEDAWLSVAPKRLVDALPDD